MKNLKKLIACAMAVATLGVVSITPISISALEPIIVYTPDGDEILYGSIDYPFPDGYGEEAGESGLIPIDIEDTIDNGNTIIDIEDTIGESKDTTVGDSNNLYDEPTNIRGDVNYDGKVNVIDVMTLRRYLLHLLEW